MCLICGSRGLTQRQPAHPVGLVLNLDRIRDQRAAVKFCSAVWGGHRDADKFWQVPRSCGICGAVMRQRGESAAPRRRDRDGREGGREGEEKLAEKEEEEEVQKAPQSFSLSQRPPAQRTLNIWACPPSSLWLKDHCSHFPSSAPEDDDFKLLSDTLNIQVQSFHARICL